MPLITRFLAFMTTILVCVTERTCFFIAVNLYNFSKPELSLWGGGGFYSPFAASSIAGVRTKTRLGDVNDSTFWVCPVFTTRTLI